MRKTEKGIFLVILSFTLTLMMLLPTCAAGVDEAETKAMALKQLGLFKGVSETDFALDRAPTRAEAMVMLLRSLGKEADALNSAATHPFTDVPAWADRYIAYAYEKGLTKGVSATSFGTGNADSNMYLTYMLRALDYSDTAGDFTWDSPDVLAKAVGILPDEVDTVNFLRSDVVLVSWASLEADLKGGKQRMAKKLVAESVFTGDDYGRVIGLVNVTKPVPVSVSSVDALKSALADKSVKTISINAVGTPVVVTGELTIPAGVTVTIERGNDFYIEGSLTNNGTLNVMGADSIRTDFINYSVMSVQKDGKISNNGAINLFASILSDTGDHGPVGGQLRIFDGSFANDGSVIMKAGTVNTHGGMLAVIEGPFTNNAVVIADGFQIDIAGTFNNSKGAVVINNSYISTAKGGTFSNSGTLSGNPVVK